jgi:arylsulfatase A-like enzyme
MFTGLKKMAYAQSASSPNVIILMTDDQGYGDVGAHGHPYLQTPNLDHLHDISFRFTNFHVAPVCAPTRSQLITGIDAMHNGAYSPHGQHFLMNQQYRTLAEVFQQNGYRTALYGKWHLGGNFPGYRPHERGFDDAV